MQTLVYYWFSSPYYLVGKFPTPFTKFFFLKVGMK